ncbi:unnamed protein product [Wickerhamomyces anomalus]
MLRSSVFSGLRTSARSFSSSPVSRASSYASTTFIGRVGQDLQETEASSGRKYLRYNIAVQQRKDLPVNWFPIMVFNEQQVSFMTQYIKKGAMVHVEALPEAQTLEGEDGSRQFRVSFIQSMYNRINS